MNWARAGLQFRGKIRRFFLPKLRRAAVEQSLARREGSCNRCGACCKILFQCPFLATDAEGQYTCRIYESRFEQCRLYPMHPVDLREVDECSYSFRTEPAVGEEPAIDALTVGEGASKP